MTVKPHTKPPKKANIDTTELFEHAIKVQDIINEYHEDNFEPSQFTIEGIEKDIYSIECIIMNYSDLFNVKYLADQIKRLEACIEEIKDEEREYFKGTEH